MTIRKGQGPGHLAKDEFGRRFLELFKDPAFAVEEQAIARLEAIAWDAYEAARKSPVNRPAGVGFADPTYELSVEWLAARAKLEAAAAKHKDKSATRRVLVVCAAARNDKTCPGEMSKTFRLSTIVRDVLEKEEKMEVDLLDLSLLSSEYGRHIHPCKACVSTAMPLCHWPCSCYPNHSLGQTSDWMAELYERFTLAHGVIIVTPVYWYQAPSGLKLLIDRLVCADGGNPDPTSTGGKDPEKAKALELEGWSYPKHLAGRAYGVMVHGDAEGAESLKRGLCDWLESLGLHDGGALAKIDRYVGYYEPYATSHEALDKDEKLQTEVANVSRAVAETVRALRDGRFVTGDAKLHDPRPK
jgi:multimeric flavodoxin WrbA